MKAALYLRSSKDRSDVSIDAQRRELQALAQSKNLLIVEEFADAVESGKDENRPGFQALLARLKEKKHHWDHLLVLDTSRVARNQYLAAAVHHECEKRNVKVLYAKMPETGTVMDVVIRSVIQAFDQLHSLMSKEKGLAGMAENVRQGWRAGGRAPMGYRLESVDTGAIREGEAVTKSRLVPDTNAGQVAKYLKNRALGVSRTLSADMAGLGQLNHSSLIGTEWNALTYAGNTVWNVHNERLSEGGYKGGTKRKPRREWLIQENTHSALITAEEAEVIITRLETSERSMSRRSSGDYVLSGIMVSSTGERWHGCDGKYYRLGKGKRHGKSGLEGAILGQICAELRSMEFVTALAKHTRHATKPIPDAEIKPMRDQVSALTVKISKLAEMATEAESPRPWLEQINRLEKEREVLLSQLENAEAEQRAAQLLLAISDADVGKLLSDVANRIDDASPDTIKQVLASIINKIELDEAPRLMCKVHYSIKCGDSVASPRLRHTIPALRLVRELLVA